MEQVFQKDLIVRSSTLFRKRVKFSQLNKVDEIFYDKNGKLRLKLVNLALGTVMSSVPASEMRPVPPESLEKIFYEQKNSLKLIT